MNKLAAPIPVDSETIIKHLLFALRLDASLEVRRRHIAVALAETAGCQDAYSMFDLMALIELARQTAQFLAQAYAREL